VPSRPAKDPNVLCRVCWVSSRDTVDGVRPVPGSDARTERFTVIPAGIFSPSVMSNVRFLRSLIKAGPEERLGPLG
jgi:hypothetical protein